MTIEHVIDIDRLAGISILVIVYIYITSVVMTRPHIVSGCGSWWCDR